MASRASGMMLSDAHRCVSRLQNFASETYISWTPHKFHQNACVGVIMRDAYKRISRLQKNASTINMSWVCEKLRQNACMGVSCRERRAGKNGRGRVVVRDAFFFGVSPSCEKPAPRSFNRGGMI